MASKPKKKDKKDRRAELDLTSYETFKKHQWVSELRGRYAKDALLAKSAVTRIITDLERINEDFLDKNKRVLFPSITGRVKEMDSFFRKLYNICCDDGRKTGITRKNMDRFYSQVYDFAGVRFSCPYYDEIVPAIKGIIRRELSNWGYATDLRGKDFADNDWLDKGNEQGYRSYHFFVKVPAPIDIYGNMEMFLCEVQGRSELQHIWAVRSHDLLYKPEVGWRTPDEDILGDMRQVSHSLRAADQFLLSIRNRVRGDREDV